jgi:hypothetical protein
MAIASLAGLLLFNPKNEDLARSETFLVNVSPQCQAAIDSSLQQLKKAKAYQPYTWVTGETINPEYSFNDLRQLYFNVPQNKPYGLSISLGGPAVERVWRSDNIMTDLASEIVGDCSNIALVSFMNSHSAQDFGLVNNRVVMFTNKAGENVPCVTDKLQWGTSCNP